MHKICYHWVIVKKIMSYAYSEKRLLFCFIGGCGKKARILHESKSGIC